jgi:hypothetical protein
LGKGLVDLWRLANARKVDFSPPRSLGGLKS